MQETGPGGRNLRKEHDKTHRERKKTKKYRKTRHRGRAIEMETAVVLKMTDRETTPTKT